MFSVKLVIQAHKNEEYTALTNDAFSLAEPNQKPRWQGSLSVQFIKALSPVREQAGQGGRELEGQTGSAHHSL